MDVINPCHRGIQKITPQNSVLFVISFPTVGFRSMYYLKHQATMHKILLIFILLILGGGLGSCNMGTNSTSPEKTESQEVETQGTPDDDDENKDKNNTQEKRQNDDDDDDEKKGKKGNKDYQNQRKNDDDND